MKANVLTETLDLDKKEWLQQRQKGIGGSDAAAIAGLNPWKSPISVYMDKIGQGEEIPDNERMRIGRDLEDYVAQRFSEATGMKVRRRNAILQHPEHKFMLANVDRLIVGIDEGLECKTTNSYAKKDWEEKEIPMHYELQCHHYMAVTGYKAWWIAVLIGNEKFVYKKIERDEETIKMLIEIESDFWNNHVIKKEMPSPDGSVDADNLIKDMYPDVEEGSEIILPEYEDKIKRLDEIKDLSKELDKERKEIEQNIKLAMKESETAIVGDRKITYKKVTSNRFNSKGFKKDHPDLYNEYKKESSYRRFMVK